ncbi:hypothetical protein [Hyalangium sp.]|nr:hypothetical protein [Hyalangium sp.]HYH96142.1 hypothetical protein [Hyalangium sp.]
MKKTTASLTGISYTSEIDLPRSWYRSTSSVKRLPSQVSQVVTMP